METAIRWSPSSTIDEQRFLIADVNGRTFKHYRVDKYDGAVFQYETLCALRKVLPFRAFDWSPHDENLVAIGQWSGEATVLRLNDEAQPLSLPIKHQRLCNAVAFGQNPVLATGLERVRNDFCLNVWDITRSASTSPSATSPRHSSRRQNIDPLRQLASSEAITSIKFFSQPDVLVAGVKGICLRTYDLRENTASPTLQLQTHCVHNIAIDTLDENYFASTAPAKDSTIQIWDRRAGIASTAGTLGSGLSENLQQGPVLSYRRAFDFASAPSQESIWSLKYCKSRNGLLGALASTGTCKVFETKKHYSHPKFQQKSPYPTHDDDFDSLSQALSTKRIHKISPAPLVGESRSQEEEQIASFDFSNLGGPNGRPCAILMRADQRIDITELDGPSPTLSLSSLGSLALSTSGNHDEDKGTFDDIVSLDNLLQIVSADEEVEMPSSSKLVTTNSNERNTFGRISSTSGKEHLSSHEAHEKFAQTSRAYTINDALRRLTVTRRRCFEGYLFNCKRNVEIVAHDPWLQALWTWVGRQLKSAEICLSSDVLNRCKGECC